MTTARLQDIPYKFKDGYAADFRSNLHRITGEKTFVIWEKVLMCLLSKPKP
jgi:hypothetical protein